MIPNAHMIRNATIMHDCCVGFGDISLGEEIPTTLPFFFRATPVAYGGSQAWGPIGATAAGLCHSHSNAGSEPCLQSTPQLTAMPDPNTNHFKQTNKPHSI